VIKKVRATMDQLGSIFKEARAKTNKSLDDASRETKIAKKYLTAIENEEFDAFPGETYLIGFMRNYAQFLGLDPDEIVLKYKDYKIQEQPAPIEQLTARPKNTKRYILVGIIFTVVVLVVVLSLGGKGEKKRAAKAEKAEAKKGAAEQKGAKTFIFEEEEIIKDFSKNEIIEVPLKNEKYRIRVDEINDTLNFSIGSIPFSVTSSEKVEIDFDRDGRKDLFLKANQLGENRANITLKKLYRTELEGSELKSAEKTGKQKPSGPPEVVIEAVEDTGGALPVAPKNGFQVLSGYERTDIAATVKATATTYFGYSLDGGGKKETVLRNGDQLALSAKEELKLLVANAQGIALEINKVAVPLGDRGQVVAKSVRWYRDAADKDLYYLVIGNIEE
jgi:transcriptional regulator with XRE-family HTH domain